MNFETSMNIQLSQKSGPGSTRFRILETDTAWKQTRKDTKVQSVL